MWNQFIRNEPNPSLPELGNVVPVYEVQSGLWQAWGTDYEEFETGPGNFSVAIVELEDGTVEMVRADRIKFIN